MMRSPEDTADPPTAAQPSGHAPPQRARPQGRYLIISAVTVIIAFLVVVPMGFLLYRTFFTEDGGFTLAGFVRAFPLNGETFSLLRNTLAFAFGSAILALVIGTALAYLNERTDAPFRRLLTISALVPLIIPSILYAPAWIFLGSQNIGLLNNVIESVTGMRPFDVYTIPGMIWVQSLHAAPIAYLLMSAAFRAADPSLEEAARVAGLSRMRVFWGITLPMVRPAVAGSALILLIQGLEVFEIPAILGLPGDVYVMTSRLYSLYQEFPIDYPAVGAIGVALLLIAMLGVGVSARLGGSIRQTASITGKAFRPRREPLGKARPWFGALVMTYFVVAVVLPVVTLFYSSFLRRYQQPSLDAFSAMSIDNYVDVFSRESIYGAFVNTILVAVGAATVGMLLTTVAAWVVVRTKIRGRRLLDTLAFMPIVIPGLVIGVALLIVYLRVPLPIYGTLLILLIAYTTRFLPYGMRYAVASMSTISRELEESSQVSGARWWTTMRSVLIPLAMPGIVAGWIYILIISFRELQSSILLYSPGQEVVSVLIFQEYMDGRLTLVSAIGMVLVTLLIVLVAVAQVLGARRGVRIE